jgi:hypothetical protein
MTPMQQLNGAWITLEAPSEPEETPTQPDKVVNGTSEKATTSNSVAQASVKVEPPSGGLHRFTALYAAAMPQLAAWQKEQPRTLGWIDLVHTSIVTLTIALPELPDLHILESDAVDAGTVMIDRLTVIKTIIQGFGILASIPIIPRDQWDTTPAVQLRFEAWAVDSVLQLLEMFTAWRSVQHEDMVVWNKSLLVIRNLIAAVMWTVIAEEEHQFQPPHAKDEDVAKMKTMAVWSMPEYLVLCASHIAPAAVTKATPPNVRSIIALTTFALGLAGNASRWSRAEYHGDDESTFSAGFA